jgi:galactonate dehydratase
MYELRKSVGENIDIMVDFHGRPGSASSAFQFIKVLEPFNPFFLEEVVPPTEVASLEALKNKMNCPIASGERLVSAAEFEPFFNKRAIDIAQPDLCHCGGFTEATRISSMALVAGIGLAPHNPLGPIAGVAALHFDVASPNFIIQEKMDAVPWFYEVVEGQPDVKDGYSNIPDRPGLGIQINEKILLKYPFKQEPTSIIEAARINDGCVVNW